MTLPLTTETLAAAYDYLVTTPPFSRWNLPPSEDITFRVTRHKDRHGHYCRTGDKHEIAVSAHVIGRTQSLMEVLAHELVHLHQAHACMETKGQHNAAFVKLAARVCAVHGWDPKLF